jgi:PAS domain S-box-containing protein
VTLSPAEVDAQHLAQQLIRTFESITDAFYTLDRQWRYTYVNREAERLQQRTRVELLGRVVWEVFPEAVGTVFERMFRKAVETGNSATFDAYYPPLDLWTSVRAFPSDDGLAVYFLDISAKRAAEQALAASEQRYRTLFERAGDAILLADESGQYVDANVAAATLLGIPRDDIIGRNLNDFVVDTLGSTDASIAWSAFLAAGEMRGMTRFRRPSGEIRDAEFEALADLSPGIHLSVLRDVTERLRSERAVIQRTHILHALQRLSPGGDPSATAVAICNEIVDTGEFPTAAILAPPTDEGGAILAYRLRRGQHTPFAPALSGERVVELMAKAAAGPWFEDWTQSGQEAQRSRMAVLDVSAVVFVPIVFQGNVVALLGAGSSEPPSEREQKTPALVAFAALAASLLGPGLKRRAERADERARIHRIIATGAFSPVFQPVVKMTTGAVLGYEALTRFSDGTPPDLAFHAAADVNLGLELEAATLEAAIAASAALPRDAFFNLNVSPAMVMAGEPLRTLIGGTTLRVILEITEHVDVHDYGALRTAIAALGQDVRCAVDDAGAGFASLRHILELAPSMVKLDRTLVVGIDSDPARQALVAGLVQFADTMKLHLVAEGVETEAERDTLIRFGVHVGQGYLFGRPAAWPAAMADESPRLALAF